MNLDAERDRILMIVKVGITYDMNVLRIETDKMLAELLERTNRRLGQVGRQARSRVREQRERHYEAMREIYPHGNPSMDFAGYLVAMRNYHDAADRAYRAIAKL